MWPFNRPIQASEPLLPAADPKPWKGRWSTGPSKGERIERLKGLSESGKRIEGLMKSDGWQDLLEAKAYWQARYDQVLRNPAREIDVVRSDAARERAVLDGFFNEVQQRIRRGQEADRELEKLLS